MFTKLRHKTIWQAFFSGQLKLRGWWNFSTLGASYFFGGTFSAAFSPHTTAFGGFLQPPLMSVRENNRRNEKTTRTRDICLENSRSLFSPHFLSALTHFSRAESEGAALAAVDAFSNGNILPSSVLHFSQLADVSFSQTLFRLAVFYPTKKKNVKNYLISREYPQTSKVK